MTIEWYNSNRLIFLLVYCLFSCSVRAQALTVTEEFNSSTYKESSELVWNIKLGYLHAPIQITGFSDQGVVDDLSIDVGDGSFGDFNSGTYSKYADSVDSVNKIIYLNTDEYSSFNFSSFHLGVNWIIKPIGSRPLVIKSLSTVVIEGVIDCSGEDGGDLTSDPDESVSGGRGYCGGGNGGASVVDGAAPNDSNKGAAGGASVVGGSGGEADGVGGGGGGGYIKDNAAPGDKLDGEDGIGSAGNVGTNYRDDDFLDEPSGSGSGGGGGRAKSGAASGGGGGGGGGSIQIFAIGDITVTTDGRIYANGGDGGGTASGALTGGGGGGGAGGSIWIVSKGDIWVDGPITAEAGDGGDVASGNNGGNGYWGRTWLVEKDGFADSNETPAIIEDPETELLLPGNVEYTTGVTHTVVSRAIDLYNSEPLLASYIVNTTDLGAATANFEVAQSDSPSSGFGAWQDPLTLVGAELKRYLKFKIELDNQSASTSAKVTSVDLNYSGNTQTEFEFVTGCGVVNNNIPPPNNYVVILLWTFILLLPVALVTVLVPR